MKKLGTILLIAIILFGGAFAAREIMEIYSDGVVAEVSYQETEEALESKAHLYPVYSSLSEQNREYYAKLCAGFAGYNDVIYIDEFDSEKDMKDVEEWIDEYYREIAYEQPDYFWVDANSYVLEERQSGSEYTLCAKPSYSLTEKEMLEKKEVYDEKVEEIVNEAKTKASDFDSILYVYDEILSIADYDHSLADETDSALPGYSAYGCLIEGKTVCSGYTLAFTSIMQKLDIVCGAEFDTVAQGDFFSGHVWNYCEIDGEYYYFDLTWDDTGFDSAELRKYLDYTHDYFALTRNELEMTNSFVPDDTASEPCTEYDYNYYTYKDLYCKKYNYYTVKEIIANQPQENFAVIKFGSVSERVKAEKDLFDNQRFFDIMTDTESVSYMESASGLHLYIFFE